MKQLLRAGSRTDELPLALTDEVGVAAAVSAMTIRLFANDVIIIGLVRADWPAPFSVTIGNPHADKLGRNGDSLVFIFPLATMLTFTSAVGKLNVRVLWHHHMLLQVISQSYCQVFVKSYNFVFEQIDKEGSPREK